MLPPHLQTPREVTLYYDSLYDNLIDTGQAFPFLYPWAGVGAFAALGYLLIDHRQSPILQWLRLPAFISLFAFQSWCIATNKARHPAAAFGVGLLSAWGVAWVATILIFNDCQTDFVRIEHAGHGSDTSNNTTPAMIKVASNGTPAAHACDARSRDVAPSDVTAGTSERNGSTLVWQPYPAKLSERLDWVSDAFSNFRGVGWNWQASGVPRLPKQIESQLTGEADSMEPELVVISKTGIRRFSNSAELLKNTMSNLVVGYLVLDVIKTLMHNDAYYWGYIDAPAPAYFPKVVRDSHVLVNSYRLLLSLAGIYTALWEIFKLGPLFFVGIVGPRWAGVRGEAWMNPADMYGSFQCVLDTGLAGWWGGWWHQTFRLAFEVPAKRLLEVLGIETRSQTGKLMSLFVAFFVSGCIHACGSYTQLGDTSPLMGPMRFFLLQAVGILIQTVSAQQLAKAGVTEKAPKIAKQLVNFLFTHVWLYFTAPLLMDDFARGGVWLYEPVAISPLRALGLGAKDDSWFCWWDGIVFWRSGQHWWDTGIAM